MQIPIHIHFLAGIFFTSKVGPTDLFFGVISGFINRFVCELRLQFLPPWLTDRQTALDQLVFAHLS